MAKIPDCRKRKHQGSSASSDADFIAISEGKGNQGQRGNVAKGSSGTSGQVSVIGNLGKEENLRQDFAAHLTVVQKYGAGLKQKHAHLIPQRLTQMKKYGKDGVARKGKLSASVSSSHLDIEQDQAGSQQLHKLKIAVERLGGKLEDGWYVNSQRRSNNGIPFFIFISPTKERFRSRIDVVRHLGLPARPAKNRLLSNNKLALVPYTRKNRSLPKSSVARQNSDKPYSQSGKGHEQGCKVFRSRKLSKNVNDVQKTSTVSLSASVITQRCQDTLRSIISTESFAALSNMVSRGASPSMEATIQLNKPSFPTCPLDFRLIHLRLSTGAYGQAPEMFSADVQQVWKNIIMAGNELVSLASSLAELSENLYKQQILSLLDESPMKNVKASHISDQQSSDDTHVQMQLPERMIARVADDTTSEELPHIFIQDHCEVKASPLTPQVAHSRLLKQLLTEATKTSYDLVSNLQNPASQGGLSCNNMDRVCCKCGLIGGAEFIVCNDCQAGYHPNCVMATSIAGRWCCPLCLLSQATEKAWETVSSKGMVDGAAQELLLTNSDGSPEVCHGLQVSTGKTGICEVCKKEDDKVLLCDACDAAYHMNCLSPSIDNVPDGSWYCPACNEAGKDFVVYQQDTNVHNCAVCERVSRELLNCAENESTAQVVSKETSPLYLTPEGDMEHGYPEHSLSQGVSEYCLESKVNELADFVAGSMVVCKVCGQGEGKKTILCSNCRHCYHWSCLKPALRKWPRKTWYCPSCLCRVCKIDADDDKILLCDACDEGYHTYCLRPPLSEIPEESWYCRSCADVKAKKTEEPKKKQESGEPRRSM